jgi:hypothetical protein
MKDGESVRHPGPMSFMRVDAELTSGRLRRHRVCADAGGRAANHKVVRSRNTFARWFGGDWNSRVSKHTSHLIATKSLIFPPPTNDLCTLTRSR